MDRRKFVNSGIASAFFISANSNPLFASVAPQVGVDKWRCFALFEPQAANEILLKFKQEALNKNKFGFEFVDTQQSHLDPLSLITKLTTGEFDMAILPPFTLNHLGPEAQFYGHYSHVSSGEEIEKWHQQESVRKQWTSFFAKHNIVPFHFGRVDNGGFWSKTKIDNLDSFLKLRIRTIGHSVEDFNSLGGQSVNTDFQSIENKILFF